MMQYMLDTDICIYAIKNAPPSVVERLRECEPHDVCISAVTLSELEYGICKSLQPAQNRARLIQFLSPLEVAPYDEAAAAEYGRLRAALEKRGNLIGALDMLIAAHALSLHCALVTNNEAEFCRVPRLRIQNWAKPTPQTG